ncbi:hypothetical protein DPMN_112901 [Dreissena polymorpha]|uniref:15-hydroxyprostaglandin dehydrogenase [NAD(+)] n=1 Tax=Dreissena polymorpha TaxID=45954 RepID=A0A9D4KH61_DREPO|nr:hypothetical protein DPMN_112901 [Dreissena polymorpha]
MIIADVVAIVTGGARGLGKAFSTELLKQGARVCLVDINEAEGRTTESTLQQQFGRDKTFFMKCDVTSEAEIKDVWKRAVDKFQRVNLMVNNAGIMNENLFAKTMEINAIAPMRGTLLAFDNMRKDRGGHGGLIINVASTAGLFPVFFMPTYTASKYAIVGFTRSWAMNPRQSEYGVSFAVLCPAFTDTAMMSSAFDTESPSTVTENKELVRSLIDKVGINTIDDVARAFVELVEKEDNNGAVVTVDSKLGTVYRFTQHPYKL